MEKTSVSIEEDFQNFVANVAAVRTLIFANSIERMFPAYAPDSATLPYIVYRRASTNRGRNHSGPNTKATVTFEVTCWADSYDNAIDLANKVRVGIDGKKGTWGSSAIGYCFVMNETDVFEPSPELTQKQFYGRELTIELKHTE